jgi:carbamoyltransferase
MISFSPTPTINKTVVGFNTGHHGGAAIISRGRIIAIAEERLNRRKYSDGCLNSLIYCLKALGLTVNDVDLFVSSSYHSRLQDDYMGELSPLGISKDRFITVDHHLSHAYCAYYLSPYEKSLVVVVDGLGNDTDTESYYLADGSSIRKIGGNDPARSIYKGIGRAYEAFTNFCGWSAQEAGKTMGLAGYGREKYPDVELYCINDNLKIASFLEGRYFQAAYNFIRERSLNFGPPMSGFRNRDAAFFVQNRTEKIIIQLIRKLHERYGVPNLCLAGGVFLNSIINKLLLDSTAVKNLFIPPCCDDTGQALGNALYGYHKVLGAPKLPPLEHASLGREYSCTEILDVLEKKQRIFALPYHVKSANYQFAKHQNIATITAEVLSRGKIVGWFQGGSEIGPRALGHRSILTAPQPNEFKRVLNHKVKCREGFRPFAPAVLRDKASQYFDLHTDSPFMLLVAKSKSTVRKEIPAVLHVDGTARVQTVSRESNLLFYSLIDEFSRLTGTPVILNTSFNDSKEPIAETPRDALSLFCRLPLDYLVIDDYLVWKA